jgi:DNA-binding response OmpR family regulator
MRLLLVEDNVDLAQLTASGLSAEGFSVDSVVSVAGAQHALENKSYVAVILDLGLPDGDGESVLLWMRQRQNPTPVLVLTARGSVQDRVAGLERGADDYLVKPFAQEELVARLRALLRRPAQFLGKPLAAANLTFDSVGRTVYVDDRPQALSARETALLEVLLTRIGRVVPKKLAEDHLFGLLDEVRSNAIEVYVHRLRKQLLDMGAAVEIHTVRGLGYLMTEIRR